MLVLVDDFSVHAENLKGEMFLASMRHLIGTSFEQRYKDVALRLAQGETLRVGERRGSAVSMRCSASRASITLAGRLFSGTNPRTARQNLPQTPEIRNLFPDVVIEDVDLVRRLRLLPKLGTTATLVFIQGETGTGKAIIARHFHPA